MTGQEELVMLGQEELIFILSVVSGLIVLITFFVMSHRLKRIIRLLEFFQRLENRKPENMTQIHCKNCHFEFKVSKGSKDKVLCPKCRMLNALLIH
jgi:predicted Zn-ribbon and HTH transcriptional regulator